LNLISEKIYARKCIIKEVKSNIVRRFLNENHIQQFTNSSYKIGLYYKDELISLMCFKYKNNYELIRFCNKINVNVVGAASKLFKHFLHNYNIEKTYILTYVNISLFNGNLYNNLGFNYEDLIKPKYFLIIDKKRYDKKIVKNNINIHNNYKLYDCGKILYKYLI